MAIPVLNAWRVLAGPGGPAIARVRCDSCETWHTHGPEAGHRVAHCHRGDSPFHATGYILDVVGEVADDDRPRFGGLLVGYGTLYRALDSAAPKLRTAIIRRVLGRLRFGALRIEIFGKGWLIDRGAIDDGGHRLASGSGLLDLFSALYGVSRGVVGVRLFEAAFGEDLDARERLALAGLIEGAAKRRAGGSDGRS